MKHPLQKNELLSAVHAGFVLRVRIAVLSLVVLVQFLLELTLGRIFYAPSILPFILLYFQENYEKFWATAGAFWSGLVLDLLLHQPPGATSLSLLAAMYVAQLLSGVSSGEGKLYITGLSAVTVLISDFIFIILAARPLGSGFGPLLLRVFPRVAVSSAAIFTILWIMTLFMGRRARRVTG